VWKFKGTVIQECDLRSFVYIKSTIILSDLFFFLRSTRSRYIWS